MVHIPLAHDQATHDETVHMPLAHDQATHDETVHMPLAPATSRSSDLDTLGAYPRLDPTNVDSHKADATVIAPPVLDYDLLNLDATAQHVNLPSGLYDPAVVNERRTNIAEVLRGAIDRDPNRRDLVLKLLETYYGTATTNQRAFLEVVRKFAPKRDFLTRDDWRKIDLMGRDIASRDELFADTAKAGRLATFA
jgi:hypothetical protein